MGRAARTSTARRIADDDGCESDLTVSDPRPLTSRLRLEAGEVHLWWGRVGTVGILDGSRRWLSDEERARGERFRRERDAHAFLQRRLFLRSVLSAYAGSSPDELVFVIGALGKPQLLDGDELCFSLSRSGEHVLLGVTLGVELGVDVERHDPRLADPEELSRLARRVLTSDERVALEATHPEARVSAFLRAWTRKEAFLKALGLGLSREPDTVEVGLAPREVANPGKFGFVLAIECARRLGDRLQILGRDSGIRPRPAKGRARIVGQCV